MAFAENLDLFFEDFAVEAIFTGAVGTINAIFDDPTVQTNAYETGVEAGVPTLTVKTSDISALTRGTAVSVNSVNYKVERFERIDDGNLTVIYLK